MAEPYDPNNPLKGATTCRHCGGVAAIVKHGEYRYVCNLCGAPRIQVTNDRVKLSGDEHPDLVRAEETIVSRRFWRGGGLLGAMAGSFGLLCTAVMQLVFSPESLLWSAAGVAMSLPFVLLAFVALGKSKSKTTTIDRHLDQAWKNAARDVVVQMGGITAQQLTQALPMTQADAEQVAAELSIDARVHSRITDEGRLRLEPAAHSRFAQGAQQPSTSAAGPDPLEQRFEALEEAMAAEESAAARVHSVNKS